MSNRSHPTKQYPSERTPEKLPDPTRENRTIWCAEALPLMQDA
ncbi:MAG: hypothetical protein ACK6DM_12065 [Alphaproteobacteria bacterium]|jgi:hypothetical protein